MTHIKFLFVVFLAFISSLSFGLVTKGSLVGETLIRPAGDWEVVRTRVNFRLQENLKTQPVELKLKASAWQNFSHRNYNLSQNQVELNQAKATYYGDTVSLSLGVDQKSWGVAFGPRAIDVFNTKNYRDYSFGDMTKIGSPFASVSYLGETASLELIFNPTLQTAILPRTYKGIEVKDPLGENWFADPEFGARLSFVFDDSDLSVLAYRHANRLIVLRPDVIEPTKLSPDYQSVWTTGAYWSKSTHSLVHKVEGSLTFGHPLNRVKHKRTLYSFVGGSHWKPEGWDLTVAAQLHVDEFPLPDVMISFANSFFVKKHFFNQKLSLTAQLYQGLAFDDRWGRLAAQYKINDWDVIASAEWIKADPDSPMALFDGRNRYGLKASYHF